MRFAHRTRLATAVMLLAAPAAMLVAQPAGAQHATPAVVAQPQVRPAPVAPVVESFGMRPGRLEPGRVLRFRVVGTPGARVAVNIPGVLRGLRLAEVRPGVYEGNYTMRRADDPAAFGRAMASLRVAGRNVVARIDLGDGRVAGGPPPDVTPPRIFDLAPGNGDRLTETGRGTRISARLSDDGSGVDTPSVRLRIDGRDVSGDIRVREGEVRYRGNLPRGRHTAEITVRDKAGNDARASWSFDVV